MLLSTSLSDGIVLAKSINIEYITNTLVFVGWISFIYVIFILFFFIKKNEASAGNLQKSRNVNESLLAPRLNILFSGPAKFLGEKVITGLGIVTAGTYSVAPHLSLNIKSLLPGNNGVKCGRDSGSESNVNNSGSNSNNGQNNLNLLYALFPFTFINDNLFSSVNTVSAINRILLGVVTIALILVYCIINIVAYFACLYIIKHTELENKYPKLKPVIKYYQNTSIIFLIIEIIFVVSTLLLVIGLCLHFLYISNN